VLLVFKPNWNPIWPPWPLISWHILNFFSRTGVRIYSKLATNVLDEVLLLFKPFRSPIWPPWPLIANIFWTCHICSLWGPDQVLSLFMSIRNPICPTWPLIGWNILNFFSTADGIYSQLATNVPYEVLTRCCYFLSRLKSNLAALASDWLTHFELLLKNGWRDLLQSYHKCSLWGPDQGLLLFKPTWNPVCPP